MRDPLLGYGNKTVSQLIQHMIDTYGALTEAERVAAQSRMSLPWEGGPLEQIINNIDDCSADLEMGGTALSSAQKRDKLYDLVNASKLLTDACQQWRMKLDPSKTWFAAKAHFQKHANDRDQTMTSANAGYQANHTPVDPAASPTATQTTPDQLQIANLTAQMTQMANQIELSEAKRQSYREGQQASNRGRPAQRPQSEKEYCHTHGLTFHKSSACKNKKEGHQATATLDNKMGGSTKGC